jgi:hypothetical protein
MKEDRNFSSVLVKEEASKGVPSETTYFKRSVMDILKIDQGIVMQSPHAHLIASSSNAADQYRPKNGVT